MGLDHQHGLERRQVEDNDITHSVRTIADGLDIVLSGVGSAIGVDSRYEQRVVCDSFRWRRICQKTRVGDGTESVHIGAGLNCMEKLHGCDIVNVNLLLQQNYEVLLSEFHLKDRRRKDQVTDGGLTGCVDDFEFSGRLAGLVSKGHECNETCSVEKGDNPHRWCMMKVTGTKWMEGEYLVSVW